MRSAPPNRTQGSTWPPIGDLSRRNGGFGLSGGLAVYRPFRGSHLVFAALAAGAYAAVQGFRAIATDADPNAGHVPAAAIGSFAIVITAITGDLLRNSLPAYDEELTARAGVIEEIESVDPRTGATKRTHARAPAPRW